MSALVAPLRLREQAGRSGRIVTPQLIARHDAGYRQTKDRFRGINAVAARKGNAGIQTGFAATLHYLLGNFRRQLVDWPAQNGHPA